MAEQDHENGHGRSHKGRWMLFLLALGGGAYALVRSMREKGTTWDSGSNATA
jgi:hypothetical protein